MVNELEIQEAVNIIKKRLVLFKAIASSERHRDLITSLRLPPLPQANPYTTKELQQLSSAAKIKDGIRNHPEFQTIIESDHLNEQTLKAFLSKQPELVDLIIFNEPYLPQTNLSDEELEKEWTTIRNSQTTAKGALLGFTQALETACEQYLQNNLSPKEAAQGRAIQDLNNQLKNPNIPQLPLDIIADIQKKLKESPKLAPLIDQEVKHLFPTLPKNKKALQAWLDKYSDDLKKQLYNVRISESDKIEGYDITDEPNIDLAASQTFYDELKDAYTQSKIRYLHKKENIPKEALESNPNYREQQLKDKIKDYEDITATLNKQEESISASEFRRFIFDINNNIPKTLAPFFNQAFKEKFGISFDDAIRQANRGNLVNTVLKNEKIDIEAWHEKDEASDKEVEEAVEPAEDPMLISSSDEDEEENKVVIEQEQTIPEKKATQQEQSLEQTQVEAIKLQFLNVLAKVERELEDETAKAKILKLKEVLFDNTLNDFADELQTTLSPPQGFDNRDKEETSLIIQPKLDTHLEEALGNGVNLNTITRWRQESSLETNLYKKVKEKADEQTYQTLETYRNNADLSGNINNMLFTKLAFVLHAIGTEDPSSILGNKAEQSFDSVFDQLEQAVNKDKQQKEIIGKELSNQFDLPTASPDSLYDNMREWHSEKTLEIRLKSLLAESRNKNSRNVRKQLIAALTQTKNDIQSKSDEGSKKAIDLLESFQKDVNNMPIDAFVAKLAKTFPPYGLSALRSNIKEILEPKLKEQFGSEFSLENTKEWHQNPGTTVRELSNVSSKKPKNIRRWWWAATRSKSPNNEPDDDHSEKRHPSSPSK